MPPAGNYYMRPNPSHIHLPPPPEWRPPTAIPPNAIPPIAIPPLQLWHNVIYDCMRRVLVEHGCTHASSKPVGLSSEDAETLLSTFHRTLKASMQKELSCIRTILNENNTSSDSTATSSSITAEDIKVIIRQEIQSLREFKALAQGQPPDLHLKGAVQSLERTVEDLKDMLAQDRAKYWSEIEALRAEQLSAFQRGPALDTLDKPSKTAQEIMGCLQEIRGLLDGAQETKLPQQDSKRTRSHGPVTRAKARKERKEKELKKARRGKKRSQ
ncbi:hypothetical protein FOPG_19212 [Fusarium oxysporum f. sp. conglutinans race 2 54008]|uniref:Uncharacterized protein n=2 Tax=Fusarium oxysporum TaxID=5507 RepID=A0A3L6MZD3_FUSOX|nr:hypothetical protein FOPG_19212 [Fusarium oxysporum f. sp. conglutinans race 2 54008]KAI8416240.1 hypothetical protein FOFC_02549 [Fusarium oxysporum]RKK10442.1 hypothetical protein BFJ65_g14442 [Fusarium oxysporum f. sp. cepae]RKK38480.1 hypothetical protein BFJ67_g11882 [Fusarium oxysporum f. sp. cepae]RKK40442.1 hypothetical protein BFJ66_g11484 [Fusarium oxysporum f. sp. cepae]